MSAGFQENGTETVLGASEDDEPRGSPFAPQTKANSAFTSCARKAQFASNMKCGEARLEDDLVAHFSQKLFYFSEALHFLKEWTSTIISEQDSTIVRMLSDIENNAVNRTTKVPMASEAYLAHGKKTKGRESVWESLLQEDEPNSYYSSEDHKGVKRGSGREPFELKLQSRSTSPASVRSRRRNGLRNVIILDSSRNDVPAISGGFRRLADMNLNAFLQDGTTRKKISEDDGKKKLRLRAVAGQCMLVEKHDWPKSTKLLRIGSGRTSSTKSSRDGEDAVQSNSEEAQSENKAEGHAQDSKWLPKMKGELPVLATGLENMFWKEGVAVGPYVDFIWILAVGIIDCLLVFIVLLWPDKDFMCLGPASRPALVKPTDVIIMIAMVLVFHASEVISRMLKRDLSGRRLALRFFHPRSVGGSLAALLNAADVLVILSSAGVTYWNRDLCIQNFADDRKSAEYRTIKRLFLIIQIVRCGVGSQKCIKLAKRFRQRLRKAVSMTKRRFVDLDNRFDLDLTYICDRLVAMSIPCVGGAFYRNNIREVARFLATRHYGHFLVFNLCEDSEANGNGGYDCMLLYDQVQKMPFRIHNVPPLYLLIYFCKQATAWLDQHPDNVVVVHCQGGKGRTGLFCGALALWSGFAPTIFEALETFTSRRTDPRIRGSRSQAVTKPCQLRYLKYVEDVLIGNHDFVSPKRKLLRSITLQFLPMFKKTVLNLGFVIECFDTIQYDYAKRHGIAILQSHDDKTEEHTFELEHVLINGDVNIRFYSFEESSLGPCTSGELGPSATTLKYGNVIGAEIFFVSFHTSFCEDEIRFVKSEIDGAYNKNEFAKDFGVALAFAKFRSDTSQNADQTQRLSRQSSSTSLLSSGLSAFRRRSHCTRTAGQQFMRLYSSVHTIFTESSRIVKFKAGELIFDPDDICCERSLFMVVSGIAEYDFLNEDGNRGMSRINRGDSMTGLQIGEGDLFGELKFLLGNVGDGTSFPLRAVSDEVQVSIFSVPDECNGAISVSGNEVYIDQLKTILECLAKSLSSKARSLAAHISRLSIQLHNVKHDHRVAARDAQILQRVISEMRIPTNVYHIKSVSCVLFSKKGTECSGYLLIFSNQFVFYAGRGYFLRRNKNLQILFSSISNVSSFGDRLSIVVDTVKFGEQQTRRTGQIKSAPNGTARKQTESATGIGSSGPGTRPTRRKSLQGLPVIATRAMSASEDEVQLCLHLKLPDKEVCNDMRNILSSRIAENAMTKLQHQKYSRRNVLGGSVDDTEELTFGYLLPDESPSAQEQEAVNLIFDHGKLESYKAGAEVLRCGSTDRNLYHILEGSATCVSSSGQRLVKLEQGEIFGEISFLDSGDAGAGSHVVADDDLECIVLARDTMDMLSTSCPMAGVRFWRSLAFAAAMRLRQQYHVIASRSACS